MRLHAIWATCAVALVLTTPPAGDTTPDEQAVLARIDVQRTLSTMKQFSEDVVNNRSGAGVGTAVAGSADEQSLADFIEQRMKSLGLDVHQERFPVRHYEYGEVTLTVDGHAIPAISPHAAGGTWGMRDRVPYARGNDGRGAHRVHAALVDAGEGFEADYARAGDVKGKAVLVMNVALLPLT